MPERRGKLLPEDEAKIQKNYTFLLEELDGGSLADHLYEKGVFNTNDKDEISSQRTRREKAEMFLKLLLDSGPGKAYSVFLETLKKWYPHVAEKLEEKEIYDENTINIIKKVFVRYIIPTDISERLHSYYHVLTQEDLEVVSSRAENDGNSQGAEELLLRMAKFEKWFRSLLEVLRDPQFKLGHVLDKIWEELEKVKEQKKESIDLNLVKNKAVAATTLLERKDVFQKEHGLRCLRYVSQTYLDHPSLRDVIGDWLAERKCAGTFVNFLKQEFNKLPFSDPRLETVINSTLNVCLMYSRVNSNFAKSLVEAGAVGFISGIIGNKQGHFVLNLAEKREAQVIKVFMELLRNIARKAGKIPDFKDSKTVEALMSLTSSFKRYIKVLSMLTLVEIVEDEEKDKLTDMSDVIHLLVTWTHTAIEKKEMALDLTTLQLSNYLARLVVNDINQEKFSESRMLELFLDTLRRNPDPDVLGDTVKCLGQMASNERIMQTMKDSADLVPALEDLKKNSQYANVRQDVDEVLKIIIDPYSSSKRPPMVQINTPKSDADVYNMNNPCRGTAIIINNKKFEEEEEERTGTDIDAENMQRLLKNQLCFENVERHNDLTAQQMRDLLHKVSKIDHSLSDCFVCIILSHGDEGGLVYGVDCKTVHMDDLLSYFKGDKCPSLVGKPKIFFIQACRGSKEDTGATVSDSPVSKVDEKYGYRIPSEADFLLAYAVVPGFVSWRDTSKGSWFIQAVVDVFTEHWTNMDLASMLTDVNGKVAKDFEVKREEGIVKQMPCITSMLRKRVYFTTKRK